MRGKPINKEVIEQIRTLRAVGNSINEIGMKLSLSKTTVYSYAKEILILPEHRNIWKAKRGGSHLRMEVEKNSAFQEANSLITQLSLNEKMLFLAALYWAEGSKGDFGISNTDPNLINVFIEGLRTVFNIAEDRIRVSIRIYEDLDKDKCLNFWSMITRVPKEKFVNVDVLDGKKSGKLAYGMCRIRVIKGAYLLKKIMAINKIAQQYFVPIA